MPPMIPMEFPGFHQLAIYKWYISGIYCQLGDYMIPTTCLWEPGNSIEMTPCLMG